MQILIIESREVVRQGIAGVLRADPQLAVHEAGHFPTSHLPLNTSSANDLFLIINQALLPDFQRLRGRRVVILASELDLALLECAYEQGALGYLLETAPAELWRGVLRLSPGQFLLDPAITARGLGQYFQLQQAFASLQKLTAREQEIFHLLSAGISNKAIACRLSISEATVKTHIAHIYRKCEMKGRTLKLLTCLGRSEEETGNT